MPISLVAGIDVGTRGIRSVVYDCSTHSIKHSLQVSKEDIHNLLKSLKGLGVEKVCIAGGYQWRELRGHSILSEEFLAFGSSATETHGLRRLTIGSLTFKDVILLPSGGGSGEIPIWMLFNTLDSGTPDKVAKVTYILYKLGIKTFTLIDDGCFTTLMGMENGAITKVLGATRGVPGKCNPGCVDSELCLALKWPRSKSDLVDCKVPEHVIEGWIGFYAHSFPKPLIRGSSLPIESAAVGAALWCCGYRPRNMFSDSPLRYGCLWDKYREYRSLSM